MKLIEWFKCKPKGLHQTRHFSVEAHDYGIRIGVYGYDWRHFDLTLDQTVLLAKWLKENLEEVK